MLCSLLCTSVSHDCCQRLSECDLISPTKSVYGTGRLLTGNRSEALASESAKVLPGIPIWLGIQIKQMELPLVLSLCILLHIFRMRGFCRFMF